MGIPVGGSEGVPSSSSPTSDGANVVPSLLFGTLAGISVGTPDRISLSSSLSSYLFMMITSFCTATIFRFAEEKDSDDVMIESILLR